MKKHWLLAGMLLLSSFCMAQKKPNIVFILADDLGLGDLGCYGQEKIKTPNIDRLAARGMRFTSFYCGTSVCAPSRSSLMTGQHTGHTYIRGNKEIQPEGQEPLADSVQTLAQLLKEAGYTTGAFGKWGLGMVGTSGAPDRKGFDKFFGYNCQRQSHRYYPTHLWNNDQEVKLDGNDLAHKVTYAPELIQQQALAFIDENKNKPFFLFIPTVLPHAELAGPNDRFYKMYESAFEEKPHKGQDYGPNASVGGYQSVEKPRATFAGMVSRMDAHVGEVMQRLEKYGLLENTIVIFSSDNGPHREGGADPAFFNSSAGLRGIKRDLYEGGVRTSFIVQWKGTVKPGSTSAFVGAFWDVMPTLTQVAQAPEARYTDGISFLPTLLGKGKQKQHDYLYWEFHEDGGRQAVRAGKWKAVRQKLKADPNGPIELYDLSKDPKETHNVAAENPAVVKQMAQRMREAHVESPIFPLVSKK
ncbi:arylsulfatase [Chitinophaga sp. GCM10012297]|uniref:Arylsulfatase n=1 Tax=Chitinophaga chungangae TaxID=2821488 RepID=A0ABS3YJC9_9BACT|nr:arylsulfatase [Chitinophaga chungangae]MBO9154801.1 arylsulfatase [Chitinophaga chungangae]